MESYIQISKINDFLYCPLSLYLHLSYEDFDQKSYHEAAQVAGKLVHENIEKDTYSSAKRYLQGIDVYCEKYGIVGKIDIYDQNEMALIERKNKIQYIYLGYKYQLYAEMFCMEDMGYRVKKLFLHSLSDNKRYKLPLPKKQEVAAFERTLKKIKNFTPENINNHRCPHCQNNIYSPLAWN